MMCAKLGALCCTLLATCEGLTVSGRAARPLSGHQSGRASSFSHPSMCALAPDLQPSADVAALLQRALLECRLDLASLPDVREDQPCVSLQLLRAECPPRLAITTRKEKVDFAQPMAAVTPVQAVELTVENQWTDEQGHTWRLMSDGSNLWWNGSDWQKV